MRYSRNQSTLTEEDQSRLARARVCIVGCGGLGGYLIEASARLGVGHLTLVDGDVFDESNLNRQLLSTMENLGTSKVRAAAARVKAINPEVSLNVVEAYVTEDNFEACLNGHDVVLDGLDSISARRLVQRGASKYQSVFIHGAIAGWYGQVSTIYPGEDTLERIYGNKEGAGAEKSLGNPAFIPPLVAGIQVAEMVKVLLGKTPTLRHQLLYLDLLNHEYQLIPLG